MGFELQLTPASEVEWNVIIAQVLFVVVSLEGRDGLKVGEDIRSSILEGFVGHKLPAGLVKLRHVYGLSSLDLPLHHHLMNDALLEEALGLYDILLHALVLDEFLPDLVGRERPSLMKELGDPEVGTISDKLVGDNVEDLTGLLLHFVIII